MSDFKELIKNLYASKDRELTPEKFEYIQKEYSGKEQDFVKNFYATIGEDLTEDKLTYINDTYLKKKSTPLQSSDIPSPLQEGSNIVSGGILSDISKSVPKQQLQQPKQVSTKPSKGNQFLEGFGTPVTEKQQIKGASVKPKDGLDTPFKRGILQGELANLLATGKKPTPEELSQVARINQDLQELGASDAQAKFNEQGFALFKNEPLKGAEFLAETIGNSLASLVVASGRTLPAAIGMGAAMGAPIAGIGAAVGAGTGFIAGTSTAGMNLSTSSKILDVLSESGIDIANEESLIKGFSDEKLMAKARTKALKYGIPILIFDAATGSVAGKLTSAAAKATLPRKLLAGAGELAIQGSGGGLGEMSGQLAADGKVDWGEVGVEALAGTVTNVQDVVVGNKIERQNASSSNKNLAQQIAVLGKEAGKEDAIVNLKRDLNNGVIDEKEFQEGIDFVEKAVAIDETIPTIVEGEKRATSIELINERSTLEEQLKQVEAQKQGIDPAFHSMLDTDAKQIQERVDEINNELKSLASVQTPQEVKRQQDQQVVGIGGKEYTPETKKSGVSVILPKQQEQKGTQPEISQPIELSTELPKVEEGKSVLGDVESTAKALEGKDISKITKELGVSSNWDMIGEADLLDSKSPEFRYTQKKLPEWNRESQKGKINPNSKLTYDIVKGSFGGIDNKEVVEAKDENGVVVGIVKLDSKSGIEHIAVAPEFRGKGVSKKLIQKLKENNPNLDLSKTKLRSEGFEKAFAKTIISEAYHKAKADGTNPKLVKLVESLLKEQPKVEQEVKVEEPIKEVKPISKDNLQPFTTKSKRQVVTFENGDLIVRDSKTNEEVSDKTKKKALQEFAETFDYTVGEKAPEPSSDMQFKDENELNEWVIENSQNPYELATIYVNQEPTSQPLSSTEKMIADYGIGKVKGDSYNEFGDRNNMNFSKAKSYINKQGRSLDVIAKEISDHYDVEITPQDLVEFMDRFPNGEGTALKLIESDIARSAADKFKALTGLNLNSEVAKKAIEQQFNKKLKAEQLIAQQDYESAEQLEAAYWTEYEQTNGFTKESVSSEIKPNVSSTEARKSEAELNKPTTKQELTKGEVKVNLLNDEGLMSVEGLPEDYAKVGVRQSPDDNKFFAYVKLDTPAGKKSQRVGDFYDTYQQAREEGERIVKEQYESENKPKQLEQEKVGKFEAKARQIAEQIKKAELPDWLKVDDKDINKQGASADELKQLLADAVIQMGKLLDSGVEFSKALKQAVKDLVNVQGEENREAIEKGFENYYNQQTKQKTPPPTNNNKNKEEGEEPFRMDNKSILNRIFNSENISKEVREKLKDKLKYQVSSQAEARKVAKEIISEFGYENALSLAEAGKFDGDVNSFIFAESLDNAFNKEANAKTPEEKKQFAEEWKDIAMRYDESARDKGRFISAIQDFYKKSPLGIVMVEESKRGDLFREWFNKRDKPFREVFEELVKEPEFQEIIGKEVQEGLKKERAESRKSRRDKIEKFFDDAKFKGDALYAIPIPPKVINGGIEAMKQAFLAGESVVNAVEKAVEFISEQVSDWDKEKFRKEYQQKLNDLDNKKTKKTPEELTEEKKSKLLDKFRNKMKGLSENEKDEVIRKSFKKLVENRALEYDDFKDIIAETLGYGKMTDAEIAKITELVNDINEVEKIAESIRQDGNRSIENLKKYKEAKAKAEKSATELGALVYNKPNILKRLLAIMQLNTLGIPSLVNNPLFNVFNQMTVRFPIGLQLSILDQIIYGASKVSNKLFGTNIILPDNNVLKSQKEFFRKAGEGSIESGRQLVNGLTNRDYFQKEVYASQIQPFTSAKDLWDWKFNDKKLTTKQLADKTIQATIGLPAEAVARLLNVGDKPQRYAAEGAKAAVFAKNLGLSDVDYEYFLEFPKEEAYRYYQQQGMSDTEAMAKAEKTKEAIVKAGEESTFQQDNFLNDVVNAAFEQSKKLGAVPYGVAQAVKMFNFPYLKIPLNAFWSVYNLVNPEVAFAQSAYYSLKAIKTKDRADIQKSKQWAAHGVTGMALLSIAGSLVAKGIVNADNDDETTKKERVGERQFEQQKSINVTKLNALLMGQDPDKVTEGLNVDLKYFGNMGNILNTVAIREERLTKEQKEAQEDYLRQLWSNLSQSSLELINNGVFSNASSLITAFDRGGNYMDNYLLNLINMGTNIVQPAMFAQMSRAQLPYYSKVKADTFYEELKNNLLTRSAVVRELTNKYPPSQIGIWGDKLERKDNLILKWFGMSSSDKNNFAQPIYEDYKKSKNTKFFPSTIKPEVNGKKLNTAQTEQLEILVGNARKSLIAPYINDLAKFEGINKTYSELGEDYDTKIEFINILYDIGFQLGKEKFEEIYREFKNDTKFNKEEFKKDIQKRIFKIKKKMAKADWGEEYDEEQPQE